MPRSSYIIKREKKLVEKSSIADRPEYTGLVAVLNKYDIVNDKVLENDDTIDEQTRFTIKNTWDALVVNAVGEWQFYNHAEKKSKCMLDNADIHTEYYIKNQINGNQLVVGSECIKHFGFENGFIDGVSSKSFVAQQQREQRKIKRREDMMKLYGNIERQIGNYFSQIADYPVALNSQMLQTANIKINALKTYYDNYINGKENDAALYPGLKQDIDQYLNGAVSPWVKRQESELFACTLEDIRHLEAGGHADIIKQIRDNNGLIDEDTVKYIYHAAFIKKHLQTFKDKLSAYFRVINQVPSGLSVGFECDAIVGIDYIISPHNFLEMFGGILFGKPVTMKFKEYYPKCSFVDSNSNIWELIESLHNFFKKSGYEFLYDEEKYQYWLVGQGKYNDRITRNMLVDHLIPRIAQNQSVESIESLFFNKLTNWTMMDGMSSANAKLIRDELKSLRELRNEAIGT